MNKKRIIGLLICLVVIVPLIMYNCNTKLKSTLANKPKVINSKSNDDIANPSKTTESSSKVSGDVKGTDNKTNENTAAKNVKKDLTLIDTKVNKQGNTNGNLTNSGSAAAQGNWMFYTKEYTSASSYIYRSMLDGETGLKKLKLATPTSINVVNDTIYFVSKNYGSIYKLNVSGSEEPVVVSNVSSSSICVVDDWIYYVEPKSDAYTTTENQGGISKMKTDGSNRTNIVRGYVKMMNVEGDFIYYLKDSSIYKVNINGSNANETKLFSSNNINSIIVDNHFIYFYAMGDGIYKMNTDGTNKIKIIDNKSILSFNIKDNYIYYTSNSEPTRIKKISTGGNKASDIFISALEDEKVSFVTNLNIIGDYIFFNCSTSSKIEYGRVKLDGTFSKIIK